MDAALLVTTASVSVYLPRCVLGFRTRTEQASMATAIGLSLGLFSLSLLEVVPSSWLILLSHEETLDDSANEGGTIITISRMYWLLLWSLSVLLLLVFPSLGGASLADSFRGACSSNHVQHDKGKFSTWTKVWRSCPWWIRFVGGLMSIVSRNSWRCVQNFCSNTPSPLPEVTISRSVSEDELDLEFRGLVSPTSSVHTRSRDQWFKIVGGFVGIVSVVVMVCSVGPLVVHTSHGMNLLSISVSWLCAIGILISSFLNGFGSVSMPYACLAGLYLSPVRSEVIAKLEAELQSVRETQAKKRVALRELTVSIRQSPSSVHSQQSSTFSNKARGFANIGEELGNRRQILQTEIDFLDNLCKDMQDDIEELRYTQHVAAAARTHMGKIRSYVGLMFSVVLLVRLGSAAASIWLGSDTNSTRKKGAQVDIVTTSLLWLTGHDLVSHKDFTMLSQMISLALTAVLTLTQARTFFRAMTTVHRRLSRFYCKCNCGGLRKPVLRNDERPGMDSLAPGLVSMVLAGATGCYFLSCIVLIKMMLPKEFCLDFANAIGGRDVFTIHFPVVNAVFACSAGVSLFILTMLFGIQRQNNSRHTLASHDSMMLRGPDAV